jgi:hypothetical protein
MFAVSIPLSMYWTLQYQVKYPHSTTFATQFTVCAIIFAIGVVLLLVALRWWRLPQARLWFWLGVGFFSSKVSAALSRRPDCTSTQVAAARAFLCESASFSKP